MANNIYINIGTENCCFFVRMSIFLIKRLEQNPLLYYAVEEALLCAKNSHYAAGIITFAQLLNLLKEKTPEDRHLVAHKILQVRPTKEAYEEVKQEFEKAAEELNEEEIKKQKNISEYEKKVHTAWEELMQKLK